MKPTEITSTTQIEISKKIIESINNYQYELITKQYHLIPPITFINKKRERKKESGTKKKRNPKNIY